MSTEFVQNKRTLPVLGVGLGYRPTIAAQTLQSVADIDFLEVVSDNYIDGNPLRLQELDRAAEFQIIPHGIDLSIGSTDELNYGYLDAVKLLIKRLNAPWWSDHLCFTGAGGLQLHELCPLPYTKEAVKHIVQRVRRVQEFVGVPFLLENITSYMRVPGAEMTEAQFTSEVLEQADCGMLLDVNNVYVNAHNHNFDPFEFIDQLPLDRVVQIHIAGHRKIEPLWVDTHGAKIDDHVYDLLAHVLRKTKVHAILLERDQCFPKFSSIIQELRKIKSVAAEQQPELARAGEGEAFDLIGKAA
ncbi:MAG TPA: DUF692 domain-containing protein [Trichormus sp.]|jgi:hypothetical protein